MEEIYSIWFSSLTIKNSTKLELLEKYELEDIWKMDFNDLLENQLEEKEMMVLLNDRSLEEAKRNWEYMAEKGIKIISIKEDAYPRKLHFIEDKPAFLYVRGNVAILDEDNVRNCWMQNGEQ